MRLGHWMAWVGTLSALGCGGEGSTLFGQTSGSTGAGGSAPVCAAGQQIACACPGGGQGVQVCQAGGQGFGPCACGTGGGSSTSSSSATGASTSSTGTGGMGDGGACTPLTCAELGANCGLQADGCGNNVDCGTCVAPAYCGGGGPNKCGVDPCVPLTCAQLNASCGQQGNGCGTLIDCGTCTPPQTCGGSGMPNVCGGASCTPKTCAQMGFDCGPVTDGCGALVDCGTCTAAGKLCGAVTPNVCGTSAVSCNKLTCASWGANCGQVSDACGGLTASCGACTGGDCCGCGGTPSVCGGTPPACVPKTCAELGANCGPASDGCGGVTASCGTCAGGSCCGCGGAPNVCGGVAQCTPLACASFPAGTCGQQSDGCGGLTSDCGICPGGQFCGGGGPNKCGTGTSCINLQCQQVSCTAPATTSISGTVYDPAGLRPLPNVYVYVPNGAVAPLSSGASCKPCGADLSGLPLVTTLTDATGQFKLDNMPVGANIPVVLQIGKWRRQITVTTSQCANVQVAAALSRLPRNKSEGDIPQIALSTGGYDPLECLLRKIGISDSEFTNPNGTGRVNLFRGMPTSGTTASTSKYDAALGGQSFPASTTLWGSLASLQAYDAVLLACEGDTYPTTKPASALKTMYDYANAGGRVFATHYHHYWVSANVNGTGTGAWSSLASWIYPSPAFYTLQGTMYTNLGVPEKVVTTFPRGNTLASWLVTVGASATVGNLSVNDPKHSINSFDQSRVREWIYAQNQYDPNLVQVAHAPQTISFNAPAGASTSVQCGRFVFTDIHLASGDKGSSFPSECMSTQMSAQEKALELLFFSLTTPVCDEAQPPPACTPLTCADHGAACGPVPNGCGGTIASCGTCPAGKVCTGGQCSGSTCAPATCALLGKDCGSWSDGCGGVLACGSCAAPQTCGGAGTPGVCAAASCPAQTCASLGKNCGSWSDGCGGTLACGSCTAPQTCGGAGVPGKCGAAGCIKKTCAELGVACGPSGDGCGGTIDCGPCSTPGCTPFLCGGRCGLQGDGCGGVLLCPACPSGACVPTTCITAGAQCGPFPDGCGGLLACGTCVGGQTCSANKCN